eukprot:7897651-Alexandrium_andersonii.AAC.1
MELTKDGLYDEASDLEEAGKARFGGPFVSRLDEVCAMGWGAISSLRRPRSAAASAAAAGKANREKEIRNEMMDLFGRLGSA